MIFRWLGTLLTLLPICILPIPTWLWIVFGLIAMVLQYISPIIPFPYTIYTGVFWVLGIIHTTNQPFSAFSIIIYLAGAYWLITEVIYIITWIKALVKKEKNSICSDKNQVECNKGKIEIPKKKKIGFTNYSFSSSIANRLFCIAISILLFASVLVNVFFLQYNYKQDHTILELSHETDKYNKQIIQYEDIIKKLRIKVNQLQQELDDEKIVKFYTIDPDYYHTGFCLRLFRATQKSGDNSYVEYTAKEAKKLGYKICPNCNNVYTD